MGDVVKWLTSVNCYVYCNHFLSAWGARMWLFSVGLFLIRISPESLQLSGIYGLVTGAAILVFAPLIGDWVDRNQRLRAARVTLIFQYINMIAFAVLVCLLVRFYDTAKVLWDGWLLKVWQAAIILVAVLANMANIGYRICLQRDWIVEICGQDKDQLATMGAVLRRIDLANKILAPIATGQIMTFASILIGAIFIAIWNFVSMFLEYYLLWKVYKSVPELATKQTRFGFKGKVAEKSKNKEDDVALQIFPVKTEYTFRSHMEADTCSEDLTIENEDNRLARENSGCVQCRHTSENGSKTSANGCDIEAAGDSTWSRPESQPDPANLNDHSINESMETANDTIPEGFQPKTSSPLQRYLETAESRKKRPNSFTDSNLSDQQTGCCHEKGVCYKIFGTFIILLNGWRTYIGHKVARAGMGLAFLYLTVLGFDNITTGYAFSQGLSESILGFLMASGALVGILGTFAFTRIRRWVGLERTGLFSFSAEILCLTLSVASIWAPGSPFDPLHWRENEQSGVSVRFCNISDQSLLTSTNSVNENHTVSPFQSSRPTFMIDSATGSDVNVTLPVLCSDEPVHSYASVALLLTGIISARFGLWITDLTVTQLFLENVVESERGVVNGVQSSLNQMMDMLKFALVVALPQLELFGILVLISFTAVSTGGAFYASYTRKIRGHLFHPENFNCLSDTKGKNSRSGSNRTESSPGLLKAI